MQSFNYKRVRYGKKGATRVLLDQETGKPGKRRVASVSLDFDDAVWLEERSRLERRTVSSLIQRAVMFERARIEALGPNATLDDLEPV
jgi:hypothetical protein